jgi:hypothetical protein
MKELTVVNMHPLNTRTYKQFRGGLKKVYFHIAWVSGPTGLSSVTPVIILFHFCVYLHVNRCMILQCVLNKWDWGKGINRGHPTEDRDQWQIRVIMGMCLRCL